MDTTRVVLIDLVNFLESVEATITNGRVDLSDPLQIANLRNCLFTMDSMLKQCETSLSTQELNKIKDRMKIARETLTMLEYSGKLRKTDQVYGDLYLIAPRNAEPADHRAYGRHLGITNEEFDKLVEEWAEDLDTSQKGLRKRHSSKAENFQDQIKGELAQLADVSAVSPPQTMKSKAIRYRDILVKDNKIHKRINNALQALLKVTGEQEKQLDTVTHVARESTKLAKSASISLKQIVYMVLSMFGLTLVMMLLFLLT